MNKSLAYTFFGLILLTLVGVSTLSILGTAISVAIILVFAIAKFLLVGFQFMDLKTAHPFWKLLLVGYILIFGCIMLILLI